ncbi:MAG: sulfatase [Candidatus Sumerlaeia bacterium]
MSRTPHIIIITADQMRADAMEPAGDNYAITPNLSRLAARGTLFKRAYCAVPTCTPSRTALFTGRYPHVTNTWQVGTILSDYETTLCDMLKPRGYRNVAIGKMHFRPQRTEAFPSFGDNEDIAKRDGPRVTDGSYFGFDEHHITEDNRVGEYLDWLQEVAPQYVKSLSRHPDVATCQREGSELPPEYHQTRWVGDLSVKAIEEHDPEKPLFLWTSFVDPHHPFDAPKKYVDMYRDRDDRIPKPVMREGEYASRPAHLQKNPASDTYPWPGSAHPGNYNPDEILDIVRNYYAMITFLDEEVGRVLDALEAKGMIENSIILFSADHGELLGDHNLLQKGPWMYECLTRVPMIIAGPEAKANAKTDALMENVDVVPTLLEWIGQEIPWGVQGTSQLPVLQGKTDSIRDTAICAFKGPDIGFNLNVKSISTDRYKLNVFAGEEYAELFDLQEDPDELHNRYDDESYREIQNELYRKLAERLMLDEDPLPKRKSQW